MIAFTSRMIIADDNSAICSLLQRILAPMYPNTQIAVAADGLEVLSLYQDGADLLILDYGLPRIGGLGLITHIRKSDLYTPVVLTSTDPTLGIPAMLAGANRFLSKPFSVNALRTAVMSVMPMMQQSLGGC